MMSSKYLVALALAGQLTTATTEAVAQSGCPGPPPPPIECMRVICIVNDQSWDYVPLAAGTSCRQGTGRCDGEGTCLVPPVPVSVLAGVYLGTIQADDETSASISLGFSGPPESLSGRLDLGGGAQLECHGPNDVPATSGILLQGQRTGVNGDGSTNYSFTGQLALSQADVGIVVSGARLSPDSTHFSGTAHLLVVPHLPAGDCARQWPFEATKVEEREVPSVIDMDRADAIATLHAEGFTVSSSSAIDWTCGFVDTVMRQIPPAGTLAARGSLVHIVIGKKPRRCPR